MLPLNDVVSRTENEISSKSISTNPKEKKTKQKLQLKAPTQERSKQTVNTLIQSCTDLLRKEGFFGVTTDKVAKSAGISIGSLYQFFGNKESVVSAVIQHALEGDMQLFENKIKEFSLSQETNKKTYVIKTLIEIFENDLELKTKMLPIQNYLLEPTWINQYVQFFVKNISTFLSTENEQISEVKINIFVSSFLGLIQNLIQQNKKLSDEKDYLNYVIGLYSQFI